MPKDAIKRRTGRSCIGEGVCESRDEDRLDFLNLSGAGCKEFREGDGRGEGDRDADGRAGEEERFIDRLSRLISETSSIRESRSRCVSSVGESGVGGPSPSRSLALDGRTASLSVSSGLLDLDLELSRDREKRASRRRTLAALMLGIARDVG